jgi:HK97 family phage portal protein
MRFLTRRASVPAPPPPFQPFNRSAEAGPRDVSVHWQPEFLAAQSRKAPLVTAPAAVGQPVYPPSRMADLNEAHEYIPAAFAAIHQTAQTAAGLPINVYRRRKGNDEPLGEHALSELLHPMYGRFNPNLPARTGWYLTFAQHYLFGAAYLLKDVIFNGKPEELYLLRPEWVHPIAGKDRPVQAWEYNVPGKRTKYAVEEVIPFTFPNPRDPTLPHVPLISARRAMLLELFQMQFNMDFFENGATLGGIVTLKQPMESSILQGLSDKFNQEHSGRGKQHRWRFVAGAEDAVELGKNLKDLQFDEGLKRTMQYVLMVLGVPPVIVGSLDGATYANAEAQIKQYLNGTIQPVCSHRDAILTLFLARAYGEDLYVATDFSRVEALLPGLDVVSNVVDKYWRGDLITFGEGREWMSTRRCPTLSAVPDRDEKFYSELVNTAAPGDEDDPDAAPADESERRAPRRRAASDIDRYLERVIKEDARQAQREYIARRKEKEQKFNAAVDKELKRILKAYRGNFAAQRAAILEAIDDGRITYLSLEPIKDLIAALRSESIGRVKAAYEKIIALFGAESLRDLGVATTFDVASGPVLRYIATTSAKNVRLVDETTAETVRKNIQDALIEAQLQGENVTETATRIMKQVVGDTFEGFTRERALLIAQQETAQAYNYADEAAWTQSEVVESSTWHNQADDKVRTPDKGDEFDHAAMEGVTVALGTPFQVPRAAGGYEEIMYPTDPNGSPGNSIGCRCFRTANVSTRFLVGRLCSQVDGVSSSLAAVAATASTS